jgi:hypothetical protein
MRAFSGQLPPSLERFALAPKGEREGRSSYFPERFRAVILHQSPEQCQA